MTSAKKTAERDKAEMLLEKASCMLKSCNTQDDLDDAIRFAGNELGKYRFSLKPSEKIELEALADSTESRIRPMTR